MENHDSNSNNATEVSTGINENTLATTVDSQITQITNLHSNENTQSTMDQSVSAITPGTFTGDNTVVTGITDNLSMKSHTETSSSQSLTSGSNSFVSSIPSFSSASVIPRSSSLPITSTNSISSQPSSSTVKNSESESSEMNALAPSVSLSRIVSQSQSLSPSSSTITSGPSSIYISSIQSDSSTYNSHSDLRSSSGGSESISNSIDPWNIVNPTETAYNSTHITSSSIISDIGINGLPYYTSIANGPKTINPFLSIYNAFSRNTTYLTGSFTSKTLSSSNNNLPETPVKTTSANNTSTDSTAIPVSSSNNYNYKNTTVLPDTTTTSSSSSNEPSTSQITDYVSSSTAISEIQSYSYTQGSNAIYYIYTQQYDVTDSTTSFTTGLPTTVVVSKQASQSQLTTSFSIPHATITTNMSMFEKLLNGAIDGSSSSSDTESLPAHSNKIGAIVGSVVGSVGGVTIAILLLLWFIRRKKHTISSNQHEYDKNFSHEIYNRQSYNSTSRATPSSLYNNENEIKTAKHDPYDSTTQPKFSVTNPFNNEFEMRRKRPGPPPPIPQPRKNMNVINNMNTFYGPDRESWLANNNMTPSQASSSFMSSSDSSFADDSTISLSSIRLGSRYDNPSNNDLHSKNSHPQGFFREII